MANTSSAGHAEEEEIDLRNQAALLARHWRTIVACALVAGLAAAIVTLLLPRAYEGTALVAVAKPAYLANFDPGLQSAGYQGTAELLQVSKAMVAIATSDAVVAAVNEKAPAAQTGKPRSVEDLRQKLSVEPGSDPSLLALRFRSPNAQQAAAVTNAWADVLVARANEIYGSNADEVKQIEGELAKATSQLTAAETALSALSARDEAKTLDTELKALQQDQANYLVEKYNLVRLQGDVEHLRQQLASAQPGALLSSHDDLATLVLQLRAFGPTGNSNVNSSPPIQLQLSSGDLKGGTVAAERQALDALLASLAGKARQIDDRLAALGPQILAKQQALQQAQIEHDRTVLTRDLAKETYQTLVRKVDEAKFAAQGSTPGIKIASRALPPDRPVRSGLLLHTLLAVAAGVVLGVAVVFGRAWWSQDQVADIRGEPASPAGSLKRPRIWGRRKTTTAHTETP